MPKWFCRHFPLKSTSPSPAFPWCLGATTSGMPEINFVSMVNLWSASLRTLSTDQGSHVYGSPARPSTTHCTYKCVSIGFDSTRRTQFPNCHNRSTTRKNGSTSLDTGLLFFFLRIYFFWTVLNSQSAELKVKRWPIHSLKLHLQSPPLSMHPKRQVHLLQLRTQYWCLGSPKSHSSQQGSLMVVYILLIWTNIY